MKKRLPAVAGVLLLLVAAVAAQTQDRSAVEARLRQDLKFLASDLCEGRGIDTKGIEQAAEYIARNFENAGLKPGGTDGTYYQPFNLTVGAKLGKKSELVLQGPQGQSIQLKEGTHFGVSLMGDKGTKEAPIVFVGYGLESTDPPYNDFDGVDVAGKVVIMVAGTPRKGKQGIDVFSGSGNALSFNDQRRQAEAAIKHKAAAVLLVNDHQTAKQRKDALPRSFYSPFLGDPSDIPILNVKRDVIDQMLRSATGSELAQLEKLIDGDLKPRSVELKGWKCRLNADVDRTSYNVKNVIGVLEGSGPLKDEIIVVGAHYDHVGYGMIGSGFATGTSAPGGIGGVGFPIKELAKSAVHYGADDNASGTTALMEVARRLGAQKDRQGRTVVFMAFTAEERGLLGSRYYCNHPIQPLNKIVAMVNMDMVGRLQDGKLNVQGLGTAKAFPDLIDKVSAKLSMNPEKSFPTGGGSDHGSFQAKKIPVLNFFTGFHEQYHRPTDHVDTINVPGLAQVADFVTMTVEELRAIDRPEFTQPEGRVDRQKELWAEAPSIGVLPKYGFDGEGVLVDGVVDPTPASNAKIQKGDRIVGINGKRFTSLSEYLEICRRLKPGQEVQFDIIRDDQPMTVALKMASISTGRGGRGGRGAFNPLQRLGLTVDMAALRNAAKEGVLIEDVEKDGPAAKAGIKKGDRLTAINDRQFGETKAPIGLFGEIREATKAKVTIERDKKVLHLELTLPKAPAEGASGRGGGRGAGRRGGGEMSFAIPQRFDRTVPGRAAALG